MKPDDDDPRGAAQGDAQARKHSWDDIGNAERVLARYQPGSILWASGGGMPSHWMLWDGTRYSADRGIDIVRVMAQDMIVEDLPREDTLYSEEPPRPPARLTERERFQRWRASQRAAAAITACMNALSGRQQIAADMASFDTQRHLVNFANRVLNTHTCQFEDQHPDQRITKRSDVRVDPEAQCPDWDRAIEEMIPDDETRQCFKDLIGYTLSGDSNQKLLVWLHGDSNTGKSLITGALRRLFGEYGQTASDGALRPKNNPGGASPELESMKDKLYVTASETSRGQELDEALIKRITGGDGINTRPLYGSEREWRPKCVIWIGSNDYPHLRGDDDAIIRRFMIIELSVVFGEGGKPADVLLQEKLEAQMSGILNRCVEYLRDYRMYGIRPSHAMRGFAQHALEETDDVARYIAERLDEGKLRITDGFSEPRTNIYQDYRRWCVENGVPEKQTKRFYERLRRLGYNPEHKVHGTRCVERLSISQASTLDPTNWRRWGD